MAERRVPGVVVMGGDVHANCVADLQAALRVVADARDVDSPVSTAARYTVDPKRPGAVVA